MGVRLFTGEKLIMCFDQEKYARRDSEILEQKEKMLEGERGEGRMRRRKSWRKRRRLRMKEIIF